MANPSVVSKLLDAVGTVSTGNSGGPEPIGKATVHAVVAGSGAVSATVALQGSNDNSTWVDVVVFTLSGTTSASELVSFEAGFLYTRGDVRAISGTSAAVTVTVSQWR